MIDPFYAHAERRKIREEYFETMVGKELFQFICGDLIGEGAHRTVFVYRPDPTCVIKYQHGGGFQNVEEWGIWEILKMTPMKKWLAPCISISENGVWLVQKRTKEVPIDRLPPKIPVWMTDIKRSNFGMIKGLGIVCHDYANNLNINYAITPKMKKADWRNE